MVDQSLDIESMLKNAIQNGSPKIMKMVLKYAKAHQLKQEQINTPIEEEQKEIEDTDQKITDVLTKSSGIEVEDDKQILTNQIAKITNNQYLYSRYLIYFS